MDIVPATVDSRFCKHQPPVGERLWSGKIVKCRLCHCNIVLNPPYGKVNKSKKQRRRERAQASEHYPGAPSMTFSNPDYDQSIRRAARDIEEVVNNE